MNEPRSWNLSTYTNKSRHAWSEEQSDITRGMFFFAAALSFIGNLLVLILFVLNRKWLRQTYGRFILALAVVDILTAAFLFAVPVAIHEERRTRVPSGDLARHMYCRLVWSHYIIFSFGVTSVYTCLVLTIERWIAVVKPFYLRKYKPSQKSLIGLVALPWLAGFVVEANVVRETGVQSFEDGTFECTWRSQKSLETTSAALAISSFLGAIFLPAVLIVVLYAQVLMKLLRENTRHQNPCSFVAQSMSFYKFAFRRATKMAACATFAVVICWFPCQTYSLLAQLGYAETETTLHRMLNLLAFFNSCLNPFIYAFSNPLYRKKFAETFAKFTCQNALSNDNPSVLV